MVLAKASAHDGHDEPRDPGVEQKVPRRYDDADRFRQRDRVPERCEDVAGPRDLVTSIGNGDVMPTCDPDRGLAHRHPSVRQGDREVEREAGSHKEGGREPAVYGDEPQETAVRRGHDSAGEPACPRQRDALRCKAQERGTPPVEPNPFERAEASTEQEAGADRAEQDQDDEGHGDVRRILHRFRNGVQGDHRALATL
jgi:hypothetical protein